jgi:short-subunit dehydrogenase
MSKYAGALMGKVVWLTGASSGLGEAFARRLVASGCTLALTARRVETLDNLASELSKSGIKVASYPGDITDRDRMKEIAAEIRESYGAIDILVANAGTHNPTSADSFNTDDYRRLIEINYLGQLNCIEASLPQMIERKEGQLAVVSSVAGFRGLPTAAAYGASKAALSHFLESIRFDLERHNIAVTAVHPGFIRTPLTDQNEFPMPFLMEAPAAADRMYQHIVERRFESHFPRRFTFIVKALRLLPYRLYHFLIKHLVS